MSLLQVSHRFATLFGRYTHETNVQHPAMIQRLLLGNRLAMYVLRCD